MFKILVVDDSKAVQAFVKYCFKESSDIQLVSALNGRQALAEIEKCSSYDLVLLDWEMPEMNGPETYEKLKLLKFLSPVIMMTSRNEMVDLQQMLDAGVSEYVIKPFTQDILFSKISFAIGRDLTHVA